VNSAGGKEPLIVGIEEAGYLLSVSRAYVYRLIERGEIVGVKVGRKRCVTVASIHEFVARHVQASDRLDEGASLTRRPVPPIDS
jgi:excisionase family DNA binding protein